LIEVFKKSLKSSIFVAGNNEDDEVFF
jgi:hypothetical protein